jgi:ApaG protein
VTLHDTNDRNAAATLHSDTVTHNVRVIADARYVPERSHPEEGYYFFSYKITIINEGMEWVRLLSRHWIIINAHGDRDDVRGPGVIGQHPNLAPGESFEYTSFCPLNTEWGTMEGAYTMQQGDGAEFEVAIGRFILTTTATIHG